MTSILLCDKWELPLRPGLGGYYEYANGRTSEVKRNARCIEFLIGALGVLRNGIVVEPFGGVGAFATVAQGALEPVGHAVYDIDPDCLAQLAAAFGGRAGMHIAYGDAQETIGRRDSGLTILDFPFYTASRHVHWEAAWKRLLLQRDTGAVIWMDGASKYLHLHAQRYADMLGYPITAGPERFRQYAEATSRFMYQHYGYSIKQATYSGGCFYFGAAPGPENGMGLALRRADELPA